jgi:serine/threonine protein kinase
MPIRLAKNAEPISGYKLLQRLGRGGFGEVWKAEAPGGLCKAIKFVAGELADKELGKMAARELAALQRVKAIRHPFLLSLERADIIDGRLVIVMELADRDLSDRLREYRHQGQTGIPRDELLRYMEEAAEALDLMNIRHGLQHMDIKPHNLFLVENHVKVADFGLVEDLSGRAVGGTPAYAAPEVFADRVSRFADQYSLAIVYVELLTGRRPFADVNSWRQMKQCLSKPPDLSLLAPSDRATVGRALARDPNGRFPTCSDFVRALRGSPGATDAPKTPAGDSSTMSATIAVECPRCGHQGKVPGEYQGRSVKCPGCRQVFAVACGSSRRDTSTVIGSATPVEICLPEGIGLAPLEEAAAEVIDDLSVVVDIRCPGCGAHGVIAESFVGRQVRCPKCARLVPVVNHHTRV